MVLAMAAMGALVPAAWTSPARPAGVPPAGASAHIDKILARGVLKVGVLAEFPWLAENPGGPDPFKGPSWTLAKEYAKRLGVRLETVTVTHETKVPILATGQIDITIAPLSVTEARKKVVDFINYSKSSVCYFGLSNNPKLRGVDKPDQLNTPNLTMAYFVGTPPETFLPTRFPQLKRRGVTGAGGDAPIEEVLSGRADLSIVDSVKMPVLLKQYATLKFIPAGDACLNSNEMPTPVGHAIDKGDPVFLDWLTKVEKDLDPKLQTEYVALVKAGG
jgi:polar amino acid transport system substrate-binding protein